MDRCLRSGRGNGSPEPEVGWRSGLVSETLTGRSLSPLHLRAVFLFFSFFAFWSLSLSLLVLDRLHAVVRKNEKGACC